MATDQELFEIATANRLLAAEMFAQLSPDQWRTPSLCAGWTVREVAAHMVPPEDTSTWALVKALVRARGSFARLVDTSTWEEAQAPTDVLVERIRDRAGARLAPPGIGAAGPMSDSAIHLRDAARPLGLDISPSAPSWRPVLDFLVSPVARRGFVARGRLDGLHLQATDQDWAWGEGSLVTGTSEALALVMTGRPAALPDVDGPGADLLAARMGAAEK